MLAMLQLANKVYTTDASRRIDDIAINTSYQKNLMQQAGEAIFHYICRHYAPAQHITLFAGKGNNGGDALVVATLAKEKGHTVTVYHSHPTDTWQGDAAKALLSAQKANVSLIQYDENTRLDHDSDLIVDGLLGTGIRGNVSKDYAAIIDIINKIKAPTLAIDVPSGLNADTGSLSGACVNATITLSLITQKQGLYTGQAPDVTGKLVFLPLALSQAAYDSVSPSGFIASFNQLRQNLPKRANTLHKGQAGHVVVIAGDQGMGGAGLMASLSAYRSGAGLVTLLTHPTHANDIMIAHPEIMVHAIDNPSLSIASFVDRASALVIGPGLNESSWSKSVLSTAVTHPIPKVIDAGALDYIHQHQLNLSQAILTPHPGEAARLLNTTSQAVQLDRFRHVKALYDREENIVVLKGAGTLVYAGEKPVFICTAGNAGMASGGMGDILAGIIGSFLAEGVALFDAACIGVQLHSEAADIAMSHHGQRSLMATDVLVELKNILKS